MTRKPLLSWAPDLITMKHMPRWQVHMIIIHNQWPVPRLTMSTWDTTPRLLNGGRSGSYMTEDAHKNMSGLMLEALACGYASPQRLWCFRS